jgi:cytoskeletal protein CcmA (bactofilin family)
MPRIDGKIKGDVDDALSVLIGIEAEVVGNIDTKTIIVYGDWCKGTLMLLKL